MKISFLDFECDKKFARKRLEDIKMSSSSASSPDAVTVCAPNNNDERRIAHNVASKFIKKNKFSRKVEDDISEFIACNTEPAVRYKFSASQMLRYFLSISDGVDKKSYRTYVQPECNLFEKACVELS